MAGHKKAMKPRAECADAHCRADAQETDAIALGLASCYGSRTMASQKSSIVRTTLVNCSKSTGLVM